MLCELGEGTKCLPASTASPGYGSELHGRAGSASHIAAHGMLDCCHQGPRKITE